uniref:Dual specificity protein phosphatase n=1 Tax=Equus caballus TaxID=9796 RepID=A0A9L0TCL9_HORSE
ALLRRACHGLKIDANPSTGLAVAARRRGGGSTARRRQESHGRGAAGRRDPPPGLRPHRAQRDIANNRRELRRLGITHVLNASHSKWRGTPEAYEGLGIRYLGVEAHDSPAFDMSIHFQTAADFIHRALSQPGGKILVHCAVGVSRSATLVLAYLMLYHHLTLVEAIKKVKDHRGIIPNRGFLRQLLALDRRLRQGLEA